MKNSALLTGIDPSGKRIASVVTVMRYRVAPSGQCTLHEAPAGLQAEFEYYQDLPYRGALRPPQMKRDIDLYLWRGFTDIVVQGSIYVERPVKRLPVQLLCEGDHIRFSLDLVATGDRWVEKGPFGLQLSEAVPFTEMPLRYDNAYGGTDELAEAREEDPEYLRFLATHLGELERRQTSDYSYPRNPVGKGYLIDHEGAVGLPWPNLEFLHQPFHLSLLSAPREKWGERPFPACFDWFEPSWFPRAAFAGVVPETWNGLPPLVELELGLLPKNLLQTSILERVRHEYAQGAHPFLWRHRLQGGESIRITAMSVDGRDFVVRLPRHRPRIEIRDLSGKLQATPVSLDCVFVETRESCVTLVWRGSMPLGSGQSPGEGTEEHFRVAW